MSDAEKSAFEARLLSDIDFKKEYENFKILTAGIRANVLQEKLSMLKAHAATTANTSTKHPSWYSYLMYGAIVLILIATVLYFSNSKTSESSQNTKEPINHQIPSKKEPQTIIPDTVVNDKLIPDTKQTTPEKINAKPKIVKKEIYAQKAAKNYFEEALSLYTAPSNFAVIWRDSETSKDKIYAEALQMYEIKNYQNAIKLLKGLDDEKSTFLLAHCFLLSGKTKDAANTFKEMADNDFSSFYQEAKWYLAVALLANYPQSKIELDQAIKSLEGDPKHQKSLEVLKSKIR
jgi:hypothetical protein